MSGSSVGPGGHPDVDVSGGSHSATGVDATQPHPSAGRSVGDIVGDITKDLTALMRQEIELAKTEAKREAAKAGKGAGMLGGAGVAAHVMLIFLSLALVYLLDNVMPVELAALIVGLLWAIVAGVLAMAGKKQLQNVNPQLEKTQRTLKEDAQWAKAQKNR
ncbi:MAG: phage holin family protein [Actinomycetota bacterium]|nr:phage holin family protein [Actinomycetota bacterium]